MFLDEIFITKMTPQMIQDFIDFGYTVDYTYTDNIFQGNIHRFVVFCDINGNISFETIKIYSFKNNKEGFKRIFEKLDKNNLYNKYETNKEGYPLINQEKIRNTRFSI